MTERVVTWLMAALLMVALASCRRPDPEGTEAANDPDPEEIETPEVRPDAAVPVRRLPTELTIADPSRLTGLDLSKLDRLNLALSPDDVEARIVSEGASTDADPCAQLDLLAIAERAPKLRSLRISGCQAQVHAGLAAFAPTLQSLELVDLTLDDVTLGRITQLDHLSSLALTRVEPADPELTPVLGAKVGITSLTLRELERDSVLGDLLGDMPSLRHVRLEGAWAGYRAMLSLSKAKRLSKLELIDTSVNNFALNQIKPLDHLTEVEWSGQSINDMSPIYLKDLPIERFTCACPRLGDNGLKQLRHLERLRVLELPQSRITGASLGALAELTQLSEIRIAYRDPGPDGFEQLANLPQLQVLELGKTSLEDPSATNLEKLTSLRSLTLSFDNLDDGAAERIGELVNLEQLDLGGTQVSDKGLESLGKLERLRVLKLHHTRVTNRGLEHIAGLHRLETLELDHTDLVDPGVAFLAPLTNMVDLRLDRTLITDDALTHLSGMKKLERLNLAGTAITDQGLSSLSGLPKLQAVNVEDTRVER